MHTARPQVEQNKLKILGTVDGLEESSAPVQQVRTGKFPSHPSFARFIQLQLSAGTPRCTPPGWLKLGAGAPQEPQDGCHLQ